MALRDLLQLLQRSLTELQTELLAAAGQAPALAASGQLVEMEGFDVEMCKGMIQEAQQMQLKSLAEICGQRLVTWRWIACKGYTVDVVSRCFGPFFCLREMGYVSWVLRRSEKKSAVFF